MSKPEEHLQKPNLTKKWSNSKLLLIGGIDQLQVFPYLADVFNIVKHNLYQNIREAFQNHYI